MATGQSSISEWHSSPAAERLHRALTENIQSSRTHSIRREGCMLLRNMIEAESTEHADRLLASRGLAAHTHLQQSATAQQNLRQMARRALIIDRLSAAETSTEEDVAEPGSAHGQAYDRTMETGLDQRTVPPIVVTSEDDDWQHIRRLLLTAYYNHAICFSRQGLSSATQDLLESRLANPIAYCKTEYALRQAAARVRSELESLGEGPSQSYHQLKQLFLVIMASSTTS